MRYLAVTDLDDAEFLKKLKERRLRRWEHSPRLDPTSYFRLALSKEVS
jgi:hypothetical protein